MATNQWIIEVANPSPYERSDYVQIDLDKLGVPLEFDEKTLMLYRLNNDNQKQKTTYQIDYPFGKKIGTRIMTFLSARTPPGREDYSEKSVIFQLQEEKSVQTDTRQDLGLKYFYRDPRPGEPKDGVLKWHQDRSVEGVKLSNNALEVYFKLIPSSSPKGLSYIGSATSVEMRLVKLFTGVGEMLSPFWEDSEKLWGQMYQLVFFPLPWEHKWFQKKNLIDQKQEQEQEYELIWSKGGPVRAVITMKSKRPFTISYDGSPFFTEPKMVGVKAHLYRVIYVYPGQDNSYYTEELFVLTEKGHKFLSFRPFYYSKIPPAEKVPLELHRLEHIPDYFSLWKYFGLHYRGYGFAADVHIRWVRIEGDEVRWRLALNQSCTCIHYFMFQPSSQFDRLHEIGHKGWYERVFKPLKPFDLSLWFPPHLELFEE